MAQIKQDVRNTQLFEHPSEELLLTPFLAGFDVTWGARRKAFNTEVSMYFLKPEPFITQMFGFEHEIALFVSDFSSLEARTMQATDEMLSTLPAKGRVDQGIFFLSSPSDKGKEWVADYTARNPQGRIPVVFNSVELRSKKDDAWLVRNTLRGQLFSRDLFDYQLPLDSDLFFFGREQIIAEHIDAIRRSQNRGIFGLRKTGKTSILYKLRRIMERDNLGAFLYYDCKLPSIRMLKWNELLARVVKDIGSFYNIPVPRGMDDPRRIADTLIAVLSATPKHKTTALVFDEIEYVSPLAIDDMHWGRNAIRPATAVF